MAELTFTQEPGQFIYPDVVSTKVGKKHKHERVNVPVQVTRVSCPSPKFVALVYSCPVHEDLDGAPKAYGENRPGDALQTGLSPLEHQLANATSPWQVFKAKASGFRWTGAVAATAAFAKRHNLKIDDRPHLCAKGKPYSDLHLAGEDVGAVGCFPIVQQTGASRGYYVSPNNVIVDPTAHRWEQSRYGDPTSLAFVVRTNSWEGKDVLLGDVGWTLNPRNGNQKSFVFGDSNRSKHVGESSYFLCRELFAGPPHGPVIFVVFPGLRGGGLSQLNQTGMDSRVRSEIVKLNVIENGADFAHFLAVGADLTQFTLRRQGVPYNPRVIAPLAIMGYTTPIGDFGKSGRGVAAG